MGVEVGGRQRRWPLYSPLMAIDKSAAKNADAERTPLILPSAACAGLAAPEHGPQRYRNLDADSPALGPSMSGPEWRPLEQWAALSPQQDQKPAMAGEDEDEDGGGGGEGSSRTEAKPGTLLEAGRVGAGGVATTRCRGRVGTPQR